MRTSAWLALLMLLLPASIASATVFGKVGGVIHDPHHRLVRGARVTLKAAHSDFSEAQQTNQDGEFHFAAVPLGQYLLTVAQAGFATLEQPLTVASDSAATIHFQLSMASVQETTEVSEQAIAVNPDSATPTTLIGRGDIALTPGADRTNSLAMITNYVPGAYVVHDMLHVRGGHQLSWLIDGVDIPNTNIASNIAPQIDPKDIDYLQADRGSYNADLGDRTYGVFDIVPRSGFERDRHGELVLSLGNFYQANDQISFGDHTEKFAWFASANGNRSNYGLQPPIEQTVHDAENGVGAFASFIYNRDSANQLRLATQARTDYYQIPYDPAPNSWQNQLYNSSGLRDGQHEADAYAALTWMHTFNASGLMQVSPFYHYNSARYEPSQSDYPTATTSDQTANYAGVQASASTTIAKNLIRGGVYGYRQHESDLFGAVFNDGSSTNFSQKQSVAGAVEETFIEDNYKAAPWLTLIGGMRQSHFRGDVTDNAVYPRVGAAVEIPKLHWVFRGFYGHYYQPPPLTSVSGPLLEYANGNNTTFLALHAERDEEHQFGVQIPFRGWLLDADTFQTRANNFLDHSNIGESSVFIPVTVQGALIQAWELTLRSPQSWRYGQLHLAYSNQVAQQRGPITGGLTCYPRDSPDCAVAPRYNPVDHDQRNTLNVGFNARLPWNASCTTGRDSPMGIPTRPLRIQAITCPRTRRRIYRRESRSKSLPCR